MHVSTHHRSSPDCVATRKNDFDFVVGESGILLSALPGLAVKHSTKHIFTNVGIAS